MWLIFLLYLMIISFNIYIITEFDILFIYDVYFENEPILAMSKVVETSLLYLRVFLHGL